MTTHEYLKLSQFGIALEPNSPGNHEIDFLIEVASEIPKRMEDLDNIAPEAIASRCLAALFRTNELYAEALAWSGWREVEVQAVLGKLLVDSDVPVTIRKDSVRSDQLYRSSQENYKTALAYVEFYAGMKKGFEAGHYWAKAKEAAINADKKSAGYDVHELKRTQTQESGSQSHRSELTFD
jgi:hypothetical protein